MIPTPIIKVVGMDCNLRCEYCYYDCPKRINEGFIMDHSMIASLLEFLATRSKKNTISVIWHGGEPLLPGLSYYEEIVTIEKALTRKTHKNFKNRIQTNGTYINTYWVEFFLKHGFRVGLSIDGPRYIHDAYRTDIHKKGSFDKAVEGLRLCKSGGLDVGCLAVLTDISAGKATDIFNFFIEEEIYGFRVKPCYEINKQTGQPTSFSITPRQYGSFLIDMFDLWIATDNPKIHCGPLDDYMRGLLGKQQKQCMFRNTCHSYWGIWPNGDIYQCEFYGVENTCFGNCTQMSFVDILGTQRKSELNRKIRGVRLNCRGCQWRQSCGSGCARYDVGMGRESNLFCVSNKMILDHIKTYLSKISISEVSNGCLKK